MSKHCQVTGKKTEVGMNVSHSHRRTKRTFKANLQKLKFKSEILGKDFTLSVSTNGLRTLIKHGGIDLFVMAKPNGKLTPDMLAVKKAIIKKIGQPAKPTPAKTVKKPNRSARLVKKTSKNKPAENSTAKKKPTKSAAAAK
ncbi:MAG: 50S ribosomal protein L28 [Rickettsiales bacterium]|jgi:large subunit ribosomal protein L28|nr:50S ribosomal protein L28 [Rickettsiales bacterium]